MKFTLIALTAFATVASVVSAQNPAACTTCLQNALQALPACAGLTPTAGTVSTAYAACLCSSLSDSWIDSCSGANECGSSVTGFEAVYAAGIQASGLSCANGQSSFTPSA